MKTNKGHIKSPLEIRLLELVRLRIGYSNECNFSTNLHYKELINLGESHIRLSLVSVWNEVQFFSEKERALFALTDYIIHPKNEISLKEVNSLLKAHFNKAEIKSLTQAIKQIDLWTRSMKYLDTKPISSKKNSNC